MGCGRERIWMVIAWQKSVWLITPLALFPYVYEAVNPVFLRNSLHQGRLLASFPSRLPIKRNAPELWNIVVSSWDLFKSGACER
jgi:hypothetical protein